jgi:hypothetical protein
MTQEEKEFCSAKYVTMHRAVAIRSILTVSPALNDRGGDAVV